MAKKALSLLLIIFLFIPVLSYAQGAKEDGVHKAYYKTGELQYESTYKNGKLNGTTIEYNKAGDALNKYIFKDDEIVKKIELSKERDVGAFEFFLSWKFWAPAVLIGLAIWFVMTKIIFKDRPV